MLLGVDILEMFILINILLRHPTIPVPLYFFFLYVLQNSVCSQALSYKLLGFFLDFFTKFYQYMLYAVTYISLNKSLVHIQSENFNGCCFSKDNFSKETNS